MDRKHYHRYPAWKPFVVHPPRIKSYWEEISYTSDYAKVLKDYAKPKPSRTIIIGNPDVIQFHIPIYDDSDWDPAKFPFGQFGKLLDEQYNLKTEYDRTSCIRPSISANKSSATLTEIVTKPWCRACRELESCRCIVVWCMNGS